MFIDGTKRKVRSWSINSSLGLLDTTTLGDTVPPQPPSAPTPLCHSTTAPADGVVGTNSCSDLIRKLLKQQSTGGTDGQAPDAEKETLKLAITENVSSTGVKHIQGDVYLTSVAMTCAVGEVFSADVAFQCDGAWTGCLQTLHGRKRHGRQAQSRHRGMLRDALDPADVNVDRRRFSFDFTEA